MTKTQAAGEAGAESEPQGRLARWRSHTFGPASELPYRRRSSDWVRLILGVLIVAFAIANEGSPGDFEENLYSLLNGLPGDLRSFFTALYDFAALWALGIIVVAALVVRRWRLARDLAIAGILAWLLGRFLGAVVVSDVSLEKSLDIVTRLGDASPDFPVVRLAVVVAVVVTAGPYLTRPFRRIGQLLVFLLALSAMYLGIGDPNGVLAALALGFGDRRVRASGVRIARRPPDPAPGRGGAGRARGADDERGARASPTVERDPHGRGRPRRAAARSRPRP